jgi:GntR family transcriptional regulator, transcriptional repressor for pyruvate dehydrogenase complex
VVVKHVGTTQTGERTSDDALSQAQGSETQGASPPAEVASSEAKLEAAPVREDPATLSDRIAIDLGTQIIRGSAAAGSRLPTESELCELYGVSRSVIRDAIRTLSGRGLVEVQRGRGMQISQPSDAPFAQALVILLMRSDLTIADVREARAAIETQLSLLAVDRGHESDWETMAAHLEAHARAVKNRSWGEAHEHHLAFHCSLLEAIRLPALTVILKPMQQIIVLCSSPPQISEGDLERVWTMDDVDSHRPILDALRRRDHDAVYAAMQAHFRPSFHLERDNFETYWSMPFRESRMGRAVLSDLLSARPSSNGASDPGPRYSTS